LILHITNVFKKIAISSEQSFVESLIEDAKLKFYSVPILIRSRTKVAINNYSCIVQTCFTLLSAINRLIICTPSFTKRLRARNFLRDLNRD